MNEQHSLLGKRIRGLRTKAGLTQEALAEKVDLNVSYFSQVENGKANLTFTNLVSLAEALHIELPELLDFKHEMAQAVLLAEATELLPKLSESDLQVVYRLLRSMVY